MPQYDIHGLLGPTPDDEDTLEGLLAAAKAQTAKQSAPPEQSAYRVREPDLMATLMGAGMEAGPSLYPLDDGRWYGPDGRLAQVDSIPWHQRLGEIGGLLMPTAGGMVAGVARAPGEAVLGAGPTRWTRDDGTIKLTHWSDDRREIIDPDKAGSGPLRGEERGRAGPKKAYYGIGPGDEGGYVRETGLGPVRHSVTLESDRLYDYNLDPDGLKATIDPKLNGYEARAAYEDRIKDRYDGYWVNHPELGTTAALFRAVTPDEISGSPRPRERGGSSFFGGSGGRRAPSHMSRGNKR